jgi:hypothetical protein
MGDIGIDATRKCITNPLAIIRHRPSLCDLSKQRTCN